MSYAVPSWFISPFALTAFTGHQAVGVGHRGAFHPASGETNSETFSRGACKDSGAHMFQENARSEMAEVAKLKPGCHYLAFELFDFLSAEVRTLEREKRDIKTNQY